MNEKAKSCLVIHLYIYNLYIYISYITIIFCTDYINFDGNYQYKYNLKLISVIKCNCLSIQRWFATYIGDFK